MKRRHKILVGVGLVVVLLAWLAWTVLTVESDLGPRQDVAPVASP